MMREKGGGEAEIPANISRPARNSNADYYPLSGWQSHSPSGRIDLDALPSRMLASVPPLSKSPFTSASLARHPLLSPDRSYSAGMESSLERDTSIYDRAPLTSGYRSSADLLYNSEQTHPPFPMPAYHSSKDSGYLGLACPDGSGGTLYGRSVLENTLFNRGLPMTPLPNNSNLVHNYRSQLSSSGEDYGMERPLERKFVFGSSHSPSPLLTSHPYNRLFENYSHAAEQISGAVKSNVDSSVAERTGVQYSSPLPSHIPFSTGSSYMSRNPPLYPFTHFSSSFPPEGYTSYASSLTHLSNYGQLTAPPPAHTRVSDALTQKSSFVEGGSKQTMERSVSQPFDATISRDFTGPAPQWDHAGVPDLKTENSMAPFDRQAPHSDPSVSDRQSDHYDSQSLPLPKEEDPLDQLMDSEFVVVGSQEKVMPVQSQPCGQASRQNPCQIEAPWPVPNASYTQNTAALSSMNGTNSVQSSHTSIVHSSSVMDINANERSAQQNNYNVKSSQDRESSFQGCPDSHTSPTEFTSTVSPSKCRYASSRGNATSYHFPEPSNMYSDEGEVDSELAEKMEHSTGASKSGPNKFKERFVSVASNTEQQDDASFPYAACTETKTPRKESLLYDSSTSEYEPPSPHQISLKSHNRRRKPKVTLRRRTITTSFQDDSDEADMDKHPPRIKLTIKTEKVTAMPKSKKAPVQRTKKRGLAQNKCKSVDKRNNRTCPLCLKTFSRADSLTCHMRVHTGDRPYQCDQCAASYKVSSHLRDHIRSKHSDAKPFECEKCGKPFTYSTAKRRHEKICGKDLSERVEFQCACCCKGFVTAKGFSKHQEKCGIFSLNGGVGKREAMTFKCKNCYKVFDSLPSLDGHQRLFCRKARQIGNFFCRECDKSFPKRNIYIIHLRHHSRGKPFRCVHCHGCFYDKISLKQHMERHKGNRKFKCSVCDAAFSLKRCLSLHVMRVHGGLKPYKCKECELDFSSGYQLCKHLRCVHHYERRFRYVLAGKGFCNASFGMERKHQHPFQLNRLTHGQTTRNHTCKLCKKLFSMKDLCSHISSEHPGLKLGEALSKQLSRCTLCSKDFSCRESLQVHRLRHAGKKPFRCNQCEVAFSLKSVLRLHQREKHENYQPHSCTECGKAFRWHASLRHHRVTHQGRKAENGEDKKRVTCTQCGKGFVNLAHLKMHMSRHDDDACPKPFVCEACGAGFYYQYLLDHHIRKRHTNRPKQAWLCDKCGKSLCRRDSLQKHMSVHASPGNGQIPKRRGRPKGWRKNSAMHGLPKMRVYTPEVASGLEEKVKHDCGVSLSANTLDAAETDLVELTPANFVPPSLGASPSFGVVPHFASPPGFGAPPNFAAPPGFGQEQPPQEHYNYPYHYNAYIHHNIPCPPVADH